VLLDVLFGVSALIVEAQPRSGSIGMLVTMKPTRGNNSSGCRLILAASGAPAAAQFKGFLQASSYLVSARAIAFGARPMAWF